MMQYTQPVVVFDIETIPAQDPTVRAEIERSVLPPKTLKKAESIAAWEAEDRPAAIEEKWRKTALDGGRGHIVVLSWCIDDGPVESEWCEDWFGAEASILRGFFDRVSDRLRDKRSGGDSRRPVVVGHNHIGFDLRFVYQRCVVLGIQPPWWLPVNPRPWDSDVVFDTMVQWAGIRDYVRMDDVCSALGVGGKGSEFDGNEDIDGSRVWDYVRDGKVGIVARYCAGDVERTRAMFRRMTFWNSGESSE